MLREWLFDIPSQQVFNEKALEIFHFQYEANPVYHSFAELLGKDPGRVRSVQEIPFLPADFFKTRTVLSGGGPAACIFTSSTTTGTVPARHHVPDPEIYHTSLQRCFRLFYGDPRGYCILALLPSYLEREGSSLVHMAERLIRLSGHPDSGFYLQNTDDLDRKLREMQESDTRVLLLGVTFALLDFARQYRTPLTGAVVMETGGMKGRRQEMVREEVHHLLCHDFGIGQVHSEYGMTELLSQAYSSGKGIFRTPPWMKVLIRDMNDPLSLVQGGDTGGINVIDLANVYSCSFIATQDLGRYREDGFEVLGRFDHSDVRGCSLMAV
ncbi:MAG: acyltransferase [Bacteroidales bacterium]|nr:acyltransferase [Bacteroidales bacterium]